MNDSRGNGGVIGLSNMHEGEVRLLRYGEFIERQEAKGNVLEPGCDFMDYSDEGEGDVQAGCDTDESDSDSDLSEDQLVALSNGFSTGFWSYANHDKVYTGAAHGVQQHSTDPKGNGTKIVEMNLGEDTIIQQCKELEKRYEEQGRPLGPPLNRQQPQRPRKTSGKKKKDDGRTNKPTRCKVTLL